LWPTIEKKLCDWVVNERAKGMRISTVRVLQESKSIAQQDNMKNNATEWIEQTSLN